MFRTLVVPLDGSPLAERAVPYAVRLAQAWQARLVIMQAVLAPATGSVDSVNWERLQLDAISDAHDYLAELAESFSGQLAAMEIATPYGRAVDKILETVDVFGADAVVMATHGRTGFAHVLYGSVTEAVLARGSKPVFVVYARPGEAPAPVFSPQNARLLVPQDGSEYDAPALRTALDMLGARGEIVLVSVVAPPEDVVRDTSSGHVVAFVDQQEEARTREARDYLASVAEPLRQAPASIGVTVDVRVGDPASGISLAALDHQADLIVMATHGRTGIRRAVLGSVAGTVLRSGPTPVLLVHPQGSSPVEVAPAELTVPVQIGPVPTF
jgi:nucleotide-binding universal stress UspA family protein